MAETPAKKAQLFTSSFFNTNLNADLTNLVQLRPTPAPVPMANKLTIKELDAEITWMAPKKAPGHDDIPTHLLPGNMEAECHSHAQKAR
ncbi:hypothetical protein FRB95_000653 [Tulasnella sp. JGI-2019a]|nr:hypothetical protein FRB95_000653 [Tulasnella sp. JGI-2019a]